MFGKLSLFAAGVWLAALAQGQAWTGETLNVTNTGGTFVARQGNVQFIFAANAVATPTTLQLGPSPLAPISPALLEDTVVAIGRPTQTFANAVQYWVKYDPLAIPAGSTEASLRVYRLSNHRWTLVGGTVDTVNKVVKTTITSAGTYAVLASTVATAAAENAITFRMFDSPHTSWFRVSADFDPVKVETFNPGLSRGFSLFSPTGNSIAFARQQVNGFYEVMTANADGSNARRITSISANGFRDATFAPDGKSIYFTYFVNQGTMIVARAFMDGAPITNYGSFATSEAFVAINATQTTLAIALGNQIRIVNPATGALIRTLAPANYSFGPLSYNPAGTVLAFLNGGGGYYTVVATAVGGTPSSRLSGDFKTAPAWSPDGTQIAGVRVSGANHFSLATGSASGAPTDNGLFEFEDRGYSEYGFCFWR